MLPYAGIGFLSFKMDFLKIKEQIYFLITKGTLNETVISALQQDGKFIPNEGELWDYKKTFSCSEIDYAKIIRLALSMHNTYGGYVIFGVDEVKKDSMYEPFGIAPDLFSVQRFRGYMDKYIGRQIDCNYDEFVNNSVRYGLLQVPKRDLGTMSFPTIREAKFSGNKTVFNKNVVFYRDGDKCSAASTELDFIFLMGERELFSVSKDQKPVTHIIAHNLPDKSFICNNFIGRDEIIQSLWAWLSDEFEYAKVLVGEGGKGKTSIAYEFSRLLINSAARVFEQVIWLTAKKKQFKPTQNDYVSTPETHFQDATTLMMAICDRTGYSGDLLESLSENQLKRIAKSQLEIIPSFIVIDDVDSAEPNEQRKILETARVIIGSSGSRILLTTRANVSYSSDTSIHVPGLSGQDFLDYSESLFARYDIPLPDKRRLKRLETTSEGSPMFAEAIVRFILTGLEFDAAIDAWKGHKGESVRNAALKREVDQLSITSKKVLFALCVIGESSLTEIQGITEIESVEIQDAISELGSLFLIIGKPLIEEEPRFNTSESIRLLVQEQANTLLPNGESELTQLSKRADSKERNKSQSNHREVGYAINQANALIYNQEYGKARRTIESALRKPQFHDNKDLLLTRAKIDFHDESVSKRIVLARVNDAYRNGQRKDPLFEIWFKIEKTSAARDVCNLALQALGSEPKWVERYVKSSVEKANSSIDLDSAINVMAEAQKLLSDVLKVTKGKQRERYIEKSKKIVDLMYQRCIRDHNYEMGLLCSLTAIKEGDIRRFNFQNATFCISNLSKVVTNENMPKQRRKKTFRILDNSIIELEIELNKLPDSRHELKSKLILDIDSVKEESIYPYQFEIGNQ